MLRGFTARVLVVCLVIGTTPLVVQAQDTPKTAKTKPKNVKPGRRGAPGTYQGRPIADVMSFHGADWLFRDSREAEEQPEAMLDALKIRVGDTVADVGAGAGYTSLRLAKRVGPTGQVLSSDVQPQMLSMLAANAKVAGVKNIRPILCTASDPKLPPAAVDLALMVDVYHECSDPEATIAGIRKALKPNGRLVLVEFRGEDDAVPIKPEHKMTLAQVRLELEPQGFKFQESLEFLPWQHIIIFAKSPIPGEKPE
jgi:SAM-dependent methyltransferase